MKFKATANKLLSNKLVLHVVFAIAFLMILCYLMTNNLGAVVYFVVLALVTSYFSKNMIIILGVPVVLVNIFAQKTSGSSIEGFADKSNNTNNKLGNNNSDRNKLGNNNSDKNKLPLTVKESNSTRDNNEEAFEIKRNKNKSGFDVDYASTVEDAYDELNKIIGGDGVKKLTSDTQNLMQQQLQLAEAMKGMQPLIEGIAPLMKQAKDLMGGVGGMSGGGLEGISNLAKQFSSGK